MHFYVQAPNLAHIFKIIFGAILDIEASQNIFRGAWGQPPMYPWGPNMLFLLLFENARPDMEKTPWNHP